MRSNLASANIDSSMSRQPAHGTVSTHRKATLSQHIPVYLIGRLVPAALSFAALAAYTRYLTPEAFGVYAMVIATAGLVYALGFYWINAAVLRFLSGTDDRAALLSLAVSLYLKLASTVIAIGAILALAVTPSTRQLIILAVVLVLAEAWFQLYQAVQRAELNAVSYSAAQIARAALGLSLGVLFARAGWGAQGVLSALVIAYLVPGALGAFRIWRYTSVPSSSEYPRGKFLSYGLPIIASFALSYVMRSSDRLMLGWLSTSAEAGLYSAGYDLAFQSVDSLLIVANLAAFPLLVRAAERESTTSFGDQATKNICLLAAIGMPAALGLSLLAKDATNLLLGEAFADSAARMVPVIAFAALLSGIKSYYFDHAFHVARRTRVLISIGAIAGTSNIALNLIVIPHWGSIGAAWTTLLSFGLALVVSIRLGRHAIPLPIPWKALLPIVVSSLLMVPAVVSLPASDDAVGLIARIMAGAAVYVLGLLTFDAGGFRSRLLIGRRFT